MLGWGAWLQLCDASTWQHACFHGLRTYMPVHTVSIHRGGCWPGRHLGIASVDIPAQLNPIRCSHHWPHPAVRAPVLQVDICDFLKTAQVNRDMVDVIKKLQEAVERARAEAAKAAGEEDGAAAGEGGEEDDGEEQQEQEGGETVDGEEQQVEEADAAGPSGGADAASHQATDASGGAGTTDGSVGKDAAVADHQAQTASPAPAAGGGEAAKRDTIARALHADFPEFDLELITALLEQEDGDEGEQRPWPIASIGSGSSRLCLLPQSEVGGLSAPSSPTCRALLPARCGCAQLTIAHSAAACPCPVTAATVCSCHQVRPAQDAQPGCC